MTQAVMFASVLEQRFWTHHRAHPEIYDYFVRFAREWRATKGQHAKIGAKCLAERVRWEVAISGKDDEGFKINNSAVSFYARLIALQEPSLKDIFEFRRQRVSCTFDPRERAA